VSQSKESLDQPSLRGVDDDRRGGWIAGHRELGAKHDRDAGSRSQADGRIARLEPTDDRAIDTDGASDSGLTRTAAQSEMECRLAEPSGRSSKLSVGLPDREPAEARPVSRGHANFLVGRARLACSKNTKPRLSAAHRSVSPRPLLD
jgi:hypothetical protein